MIFEWLCWLFGGHSYIPFFGAIKFCHHCGKLKLFGHPPLWHPSGSRE